jgi:O-antigen/teichoic acid export membrane protein
MAPFAGQGNRIWHDASSPSPRACGRGEGGPAPFEPKLKASQVSLGRGRRLKKPATLRFWSTALSALVTHATRPPKWLRPWLPQRIALWLDDGSDQAQAQLMAGTAFLVRVASAGIIYVTQVLLARWMGAFEFGIYLLVWSWVGFLGMLAPLGLAYSAQRFIPEYRTRGDFSRLAGFVRGARLICFALGLVAGGLLAATVLLLGERLPAYYATPFLLAALALPIFTVSAAQDTMGRAFDWMLTALLPGFILHPLIIVFGVGALYLAGVPITALLGLSVAVAGLWFIVALQFVLIGRKLGRELPPAPRRYELRTWMATALPIFMVDGFFILLSYADMLVLQLYVGPVDVAIYFAAAKTLALVSFVYYAVSATVGHRFSEYHAAGDRDGLARMVADTVRWTFWPSLGLAIPLVLIGRFILSLFGDGFACGYPVLCVLAIGIVGRASVGPSERLLNMVGHQKICAAVYASAFAVNLALCFLLIPRFGTMGAAVATAVAMLLESTLLYIAVRKRLAIDVFVFSPRRT